MHISLFFLVRQSVVALGEVTCGNPDSFKFDDEFLLKDRKKELPSNLDEEMGNIFVGAGSVDINAGEDELDNYRDENGNKLSRTQKQDLLALQDSEYLIVYECLDVFCQLFIIFATITSCQETHL